MLMGFDLSCRTVYGRAVGYRRLSDREREIFHRPDGTGIGSIELSPFVFIGRVAGNDLEMWTETGHWREDGTPHPFDLAIVREK